MSRRWMWGAALAVALGSGLTWAFTAGPLHQAAHEASHDVYTCPMHPEVISDKPGECPICGMRLVKRPTEPRPQGSGAPTAADTNEVALSPQQQVLANVATSKVAVRPLSETVLAAGRIMPDERRLSTVPAWIDGRIDRLYVNTTGQWVGKGQAVASLYSPDAVVSQQEYLLALKGYQEAQQSPYGEVREGAKALLEASRQRLKLWGIDESQILAVARSGEARLGVTVRSPDAGVVTKRYVTEGQYVTKGQPLFDLADLSRIWVEADVPESKMGSVRLGAPASVTAVGYPGKQWQGKVAFVQPALNPESRTLQVRIELPNSGTLLKPNMFVQAELRSAQAHAVAVPASAVIDTGKRRVVWVERAPGHFVPRDVQLGTRSGDFYPVISGLSAGEMVVTQGSFLIDATAQLRGGGAGHEGHGAATGD